MKKQIIARAWVLSHGRDCDGCYSRRVGCYESISEANKGADESNEWSDGIRHVATEKWSEVIEYCEDYDMLDRINNYKFV